MPKWAEVLGLDPDEREQLVELAELAHTPPAIRARYLAMKAMLTPRQHLRAAEPRIPYASAAEEDPRLAIDRIHNPDAHPRETAPTHPHPAPLSGGSHGPD